MLLLIVFIALFDLAVSDVSPCITSDKAKNWGHFSFYNTFRSNDRTTCWKIGTSEEFITRLFIESYYTDTMKTDDVFDVNLTIYRLEQGEQILIATIPVPYSYDEFDSQTTIFINAGVEDVIVKQLPFYPESAVITESIDISYSRLAPSINEPIVSNQIELIFTDQNLYRTGETLEYKQIQSLPDDAIGFYLEVVGENNLNRNEHVIDIYDASAQDSLNILLHKVVVSANKTSTLLTLPIETTQILIAWQLEFSLWVVFPKIRFRIETTRGVFSCNFAEDFCKWHNESSNAIWTIRTLPNYVQTAMLETGSGTGNNIAVMTSFNFTTRKLPVCLYISYRLHGDAKLAVNLHTNTVVSELWVRSGSQGEKWMKSQVQFPDNTEGYLTIEAEENESSNGKVMISELIASHHCSKKEVSVYCEFEDSFCGWSQDQADDGNWELASQLIDGKRINLILVPTFIPSASPRLVSPIIQTNQSEVCASIDVLGGGELTIYHHSEKSNTTTKLWSMCIGNDLTSNGKPVKYNFNVNFTEAKSRIILEGNLLWKETRSRKLGVVRFNFTNGSCKPLDCVFSNSLCSWRLKTLGQLVISDEYITMKHSQKNNNFTLVSPPVSDLKLGSYLCLKYKFDWNSSLPMVLDIFSGNFHGSIGAMSSSSRFLTDCVILSDVRPLEVTITSRPWADLQAGTEATLRIHSVWTTDSHLPDKPCNFVDSFCGWSQTAVNDYVWMSDDRGLLVRRFNFSFGFDRDKESILTPIPATIDSPPFDNVTDDQCLEFWYLVETEPDYVLDRLEDLETLSVVLEVQVVSDGSDDVTSLWKKNLVLTHEYMNIVSIPLINIPQPFSIFFSASLNGLQVLLHDIEIKECKWSK